MIGKRNAAASFLCAKAGILHRPFVLAAAIAVLGSIPARAFAVTVSGHVTEHLTGNALVGIRIGIWARTTPFDEAEVGSMTTATDGAYAWSGTCPYNCSLRIKDERYLDASRALDGSATEIVADFSLLQPVSIAGTIKVDGTVPTNTIGVSIFYYSEIEGRWMGVLNTYQEENGHYVISRLPPDVPYRLCAGGFDADTIEQCFDHHDRISLAEEPDYDLVDVGEGERRDDIDFDLRSGGGISGTIHDGYLDVPLADTDLVLRYSDEAGTDLGSSRTRTDANGRYEVRGFVDGAFYVTAIVDGYDAPFFDSMQIYPGMVCEDYECPPVTTGQRLTVTGGSTLTSIDFTVHSAVVIKGRVTDSTNGQGLAGVDIYADNGWHPSATSREDGQYMMYLSDRLMPYLIYTRGAQPYIDQIYPGIPCIRYFLNECDGGAQSFHPPRGAVVEHIDFALQPGAAISGTLYDAATGMPRVGVIRVYDSDFNVVWSTEIAEWESGSYTSGAWYPGTYYVQALGYPGYAGLDGCAFYDARPCPTGDQDPASVAPTPITIEAGQIRSGIDFHLDSNTIFRTGFETVEAI